MPRVFDAVTAIPKEPTWTRVSSNLIGLDFNQHLYTWDQFIPIHRSELVERQQAFLSASDPTLTHEAGCRLVYEKTCRAGYLWLLVVLTANSASTIIGGAALDNRPPAVSIVWPRPGDSFSTTTLIKIKAEAVDPDGSVAQVQFFAGTNLIGVVTNAPFNVLWPVDRSGPEDGGPWNLRAVADDNSGAKSESEPVTIYYYIDPPPGPVVEIISPSSGAMFAAPATFRYSAEILASLGDSGPVEFFVGTNSWGVVERGTPFSATTPPSSVTVTNLAEGEYDLTVRYLGGNGRFCTCSLLTNTVRVVRLGVRQPGLTPEGQLQFDVVTSFPGKETLIQRSANLINWESISTNRPATNAFTFREPATGPLPQRFYRAVVAR